MLRTTRTISRQSRNAIVRPVQNQVPDQKKSRSYSNTSPSPDVVSDILTMSTSSLVATGLVSVAAVPLGLAAMGYRVASPNEMLVKTGLGINDMELSKKTIHWPFQRLSRINLSPRTYHSLIEAMSKEKIAFLMPAVFTIGPKDDENDPQALKRYAKFLNEVDEDRIISTINGIVQGEGRILAASSHLDDLFNSREHFKTEVTEKINEELNKLGLVVYNANIEEMKDLVGNEYFSYLRKRALEGAVNRARVDVAEQKKMGDTGEKGFEGETRQTVAAIEKEAKLIENSRDRDIYQSNTELEIAKAEYNRQIRIASAEADAAAEKRRFELQREVETHRASQEMEKLRADELTEASVQAEVRIKQADGVAQALRVRAEAELYAEQQKALGILAIKEAEAEGLRRLAEAAGGTDSLAKYLLIRDGVLPELAEKQAMALQGLNPRVNIWQTGPTGTDSQLVSNTLTDLFKTGMPLFAGIKDQTGYDFLGSIGVKKGSGQISSHDESK